jgi:hypothetical protein
MESLERARRGEGNGNGNGNADPERPHVETLTIRNEVFSLVPSVGSDEMTVRFSGNGQMDTAAILGTYLRTLHAEVCRLALSTVIFDFEDLYFMNSSCFKALATWIHAVAKTSTSRGSPYRIRFLTNSKLRWQARSLEGLRSLSPDLVAVEPSPRSL